MPLLVISSCGTPVVCDIVESIEDIMSQFSINEFENSVFCGKGILVEKSPGNLISPGIKKALSNLAVRINIQGLIK